MPNTQTAPPAPADERHVSIYVQLPASLHRRFKAAAAAEGLTLKDAVVEALQDWTLSR